MDLLKRKQYQTQTFFPQTTCCSAVVRQGRWQCSCICTRKKTTWVSCRGSSPRDSCEAAPLPCYKLHPDELG